MSNLFLTRCIQSSGIDSGFLLVIFFLLHQITLLEINKRGVNISKPIDINRFLYKISNQMYNVRFIMLIAHDEQEITHLICLLQIVEKYLHNLHLK